MGTAEAVRSGEGSGAQSASRSRLLASETGAGGKLAASREAGGGRYKKTSIARGSRARSRWGGVREVAGWSRRAGRGEPESNLVVPVSSRRRLAEKPRYRAGYCCDANVEGLARGEARERREGTRGHWRGERRRERETCTLRCTGENERDTWLQRERERAHT